MPATPSTGTFAAFAVPLAAATLAAGYIAGIGGPEAAIDQAAAALTPAPTPVSATSSLAAEPNTGSASRTSPTLTFPDIRTIDVALSPDSGGTRGVATFFEANFSDTIPVHARTQVESAFTFQADKPLPDGAWVWTAPDEMVYRTETFLPAHTTITLRGNTALGHGSLFTDAGAVYVTPTIPETTATIGRDLTTQIDTAAHTATITVDGAPTRTIPISAGKAGYETLAGVKATGEKYEVLRMTSASAGVSEFYDLMVPYSVRLTDHGEFIHAAPWNPQIGQANTSHGCTNMTIDDARWYYEQSIPGDPVITSGPGLPEMSRADSSGGVWNYTWQEWVNQSDNT